MSKATSKLRFAALIRVSTEKQEKQGESLRTQETQINQAVDSIGGTITARYAGQEHATAGYERELVAKLLRDVNKKRKPFEAVIVADPSRWSRDNVMSESGLELLRENGIRFYVLTTEYDLFNPEARLFLSLSTTIASYQARTQKQKSVLNCIERAKRGIPTSGKLPFGRTFDRQTQTWGIDTKTKEMIEDVANRYLAGESMATLAEECGLNHSFLHKTLTQRCSDTHSITWNVPDLNIAECVKMKVPRLLPEKTINAIRRKAHANKTYQHGTSKHPYLLSGFVFCAECGYGLFGQTNQGCRRYYRHAHTTRAKECSLRPRPWIRTDELDESVISMLFETFGNPKAVERAIMEAQPNREKIDEYHKRLERLNSELARLERSRDSILKLLTKETLTEAQAEKQLIELNQRESTVNEEIDHLRARLDNTPSNKEIRIVVDQVTGATKIRRRGSALLKAKISGANSNYDSMTWDEKRALVEKVFPCTASRQRPFGVYVEPIDGQTDHRRKRWRFRIHGITPVDGRKSVTQCASH